MGKINHYGSIDFCSKTCKTLFSLATHWRLKANQHLINKGLLYVPLFYIGSSLLSHHQPYGLVYRCAWDETIFDLLVIKLAFPLVWSNEKLPKVRNTEKTNGPPYSRLNDDWRRQHWAVFGEVLGHRDWNFGKESYLW